MQNFWAFHQNRYPDGKKAHENMTNILPHYLKAKYKLKPKSVTITHLLERLKQNQKYFSNIKY